MNESIMISVPYISSCSHYARISIATRSHKINLARRHKKTG